MMKSDRSISDTNAVPPAVACLLMILAACATLIVSPHSVISFTYFFLLVCLVNLVFTFNSVNLICAFSISTLLMLIQAVAHQAAAPEFLGMTPGQIGVGTDDVYYYSATTRYFPNTLPMDAWQAHNFSNHPFSAFLRVLTFIPSLLVHTYPIDIMFACVFAATFTPLCVMKIADIVSDDILVGKTAFWISLFCPIYVANGLIIMRDGWTATLLSVALLFFLEERFFKVAITILVLTIIRLESGLQMVLLLGLLMALRYVLSGHATQRTKLLVVVSLIVGPVIAGLAGPEVVRNIQQELGNNPFYRSSFLEFLNTSEESLYARIMSGHPVIRMTFGTAFFFFAPFMDTGLWSKGYFIVRTIFTSMFGILNVLYVYGFVNAFFASLKNRKLDLFAIILCFIAMTYILSQYSMQFRHKTMIMPMYYVAVAYGFYYSSRRSRLLGFSVATMLLSAQLYMLFS